MVPRNTRYYHQYFVLFTTVAPVKEIRVRVVPMLYESLRMGLAHHVVLSSPPRTHLPFPSAGKNRHLFYRQASLWSITRGLYIIVLEL